MSDTRNKYANKSVEGALRKMTDVMYQPYAYSAYFPYQRHFADQKLHNLSKLQEAFPSDPFGATPRTDQQRIAHAKSPTFKQGPSNQHGKIGNLKQERVFPHKLHNCSASSTKNNLPLSGKTDCSKNTKYESLFGPTDTAGENECQPTDTRYLNAQCVLLTYFSGDVASHVDEHFSRALNQPKTSLMCHRNLPASFWNSSTDTTHHDFPFSPDSFMSSIHSLSTLHQDSWAYHVGSQSHAYNTRIPDYPHHQTPSSRRYSAHYPPLFVQQAVPMAARLVGCDVTRSSGDAWNSRYHGDPHGIHSDFASRSHFRHESSIEGMLQRMI